MKKNEIERYENDAISLAYSVRNKFIITEQVENDRAYLGAQALRNSAVLADIERSLSDKNPEYEQCFKKIVHAYGMAAAEKIYFYDK